MYQPQPGTIPFRVIAKLRELPPGEELSTAALADALDISTSSITPSMMPAVSHGAVHRERREGLLYWRISDEPPAVPPKEDDDDEAAITQPVHVAPAAAKAPTSVKLTPIPPRAVFGVFSTGEMMIRRGAVELMLDQEETNELLTFLGRRAK